MEDVDHLFMRCCFVQEIWNIVVDYYLFSIRADLSYIDWIEHMLKYVKVYNKFYHRSFRRIFVIYFKFVNVQPAHIIISTVELFDYMRYYKLVFGILGQDGSNCSQIKSKRKSRAKLC